MKKVYMYGWLKSTTSQPLQGAVGNSFIPLSVRDEPEPEISIEMTYTPASGVKPTDICKNEVLEYQNSYTVISKCFV